MWVHQLQSPDLLEKLMAELNKKQGGAKEIGASKSEKGKKRREFCKFGTASFMSEESSSEEEEALKVNEPASSVGKELGRAFRSELRIERRSKSHRPMKTQGTVFRECEASQDGHLPKSQPAGTFPEKLVAELACLSQPMTSGLQDGCKW